MGALREAAIRGQYERLVQEIAQRERAEQALRASERRTASSRKGSSMRSSLPTSRESITLFNPAAQALFGYSEPEVLGQPLTILMPEEYREAHRGGFRRYLETRETRIIGRTVEVRRPAEGRRDLPAGDVALGDRAARGDRLPGRDPRPDRAPAPARAMIVQAEKLASLGLLAPGWRTRSTTRWPTWPTTWPCSSATCAS